MATKQKAAATPPTDVTVPRSVLKQFINLVAGLEQACSRPLQRYQIAYQ